MGWTLGNKRLNVILSRLPQTEKNFSCSGGFHGWLIPIQLFKMQWHYTLSGAKMEMSHSNIERIIYEIWHAS